LIAYDDAKSDLEWIDGVRSDEKWRAASKGDEWYENYRRAENKDEGFQDEPRESGVMKAVAELKARFESQELESKQSKNYLSDEAASEKLSKTEQEQLPVYKRDNNFIIDDKRMNPYDEIKLKVSNKMIAKGMGPSLPSEINGDEKQYYRPAGPPNEQAIEKRDEVLEHKIPNYNMFKRSLAPQRKLLATDNYEYESFPDVADFYDSIGEDGNCTEGEFKNTTQSSTTAAPRLETTTAPPPTPTTAKVQLNVVVNGTVILPVANATSGNSKSLKAKREVTGGENSKIDMGQLISGELPNKIMLVRTISPLKFIFTSFEFSLFSSPYLNSLTVMKI
jgi:hypothetical protein